MDLYVKQAVCPLMHIIVNKTLFLIFLTVNRRLTWSPLLLMYSKNYYHPFEAKGVKKQPTIPCAMKEQPSRQ